MTMLSANNNDGDGERVEGRGCTGEGRGYIGEGIWDEWTCCQQP